MKSTTTRPKGKRGEPAWSIAELYPLQGMWDEDDYLCLDTNRLVEYEDGCIEVLPVPTTSHQRIVTKFYRQLFAFVDSHGLGEVLVSALPVRLWKGKYREPDVVFMHADHADRVHEQFWDGADLVMEIVSDDPESRKRDLVEKPPEYARARIPEYWIVDPQEKNITVLRLKGRKYVEHGRFGPGAKATSHLLAGFAIDVNAVFKAK